MITMSLEIVLVVELNGRTEQRFMSIIMMIDTMESEQNVLNVIENTTELMKMTGMIEKNISVLIVEKKKMNTKNIKTYFQMMIQILREESD